MNDWRFDFISKDEIKKQATNFLDKYNRTKEIPVPIDLIAERIGINIVSFSDLWKNFEIDAFMSRDLTTIYIDSHVYYYVENRYRFSIAHEMGHFYMHREFYDSLKFDTIEEWKDLYQRLDDESQRGFEFQANAFASYVLAPDYRLKPSFIAQLDHLRERIQRSKEKHIERDSYVDYVINIIAEKLTADFNVSLECMEKRIKYDPAYVKLIP